jgi:uncharacterized protein YodC (DUF2158 family)
LNNISRVELIGHFISSTKDANMIDLQAPTQNKDFSIGGTVRLNSGSPDLTVTGFTETGRVMVEWPLREGVEAMTAARQCFYRV